MTWLNLIILFVGLFVSGWSEAAPKCAANLPERIIPQAGEKGMAMFPRETIKAEYQPASKMSTKGFDHLVGMLNAVTVYPCERNRPATIEIKSMELGRLEKDGTFVPEAAFSFDGKGTLNLDGGHWRRNPEWFVSGQPAIQRPVSRQTSDMLSIDLKSIPENIVHVWTGPRLQAKAGERYGIRAMVRVTGDARLQFGMDYWKGKDSPYNGWSEGCRQSNNCEAWLSDWIGDTNGEFREVITPSAFSAARP